jgi:uncharacterized membrane protein YedE/YeeE
MKSHLTALLAGIVFGVGLGISGMTQPPKVIGFLDLFGSWDPSLLFVMVGAILVHFVLGRVARSRPRPWLDARFHLPPQGPVDRKLVSGAAIFGIGWGLAGYCPGPAIVALGSGAQPALVFVAAMALGMVIQHFAAAPRDGRDAQDAGEAAERASRA